MGDTEGRIEYSPEELAEIEHVLSVLPVSEMRTERAGALYTGSDVAPVTGDMDYDGVAGEETAEVGLEEETTRIEGEADEFIDVTDLIHEVEDKATAGAPAEPDEFALTPAEEPIELSEFDLVEVSEGAEAPPAEPGFEAGEEAGELSTLDELEELTAEQDSISEVDLPGSGIDAGEAFPEEPLADIEAGIDFGEEPPAGREKGADKSFQLDSGAAMDVPDLSEIDLDAAVAEIPEMDIADLPDVEPGALAGIEEKPPSAELDELAGVVSEIPGEDLGASMDDFGEISEVSIEEDEPVQPKKASKREALPREEEITGIRGIDAIDEVVKSEPIPEIEPEEEPLVEFEEPAGKDAPVELSDRELRKLKTAIMLFHPALRREIRDTIINDLLSPKDTRQMVDLIITGKPEDNVQRFLEKKTGRRIDTAGAAGEPGRKVITARPEYTKSGIERQKKLLKMTKIFGAATAAAFVVTILLYQFVYKPIVAKNKIEQGVALIRRPGVPTFQKKRDFENAEKLFREVDEDYVSDYLPGYNAYARAYYDVKEFDLSHDKLVKAFNIRQTDIETINNIGYFYSRLPKEYYDRHWETLKPPDKKQLGETPESRLDVAIRFYRYTLTREPDNVTALYGIGNTYMYQGRYFEARRYYENIIKVDKSSVVGHSGLLNLFIERDEFAEVVTQHTRMVDRDILPDIESALLAKLAFYYLGKKRSDSVNVRFDYGVKSDRLRDLADNPYPVVRSVLKVLGDKDTDYPPLYVHQAKLAQAEGNYHQMREYVKVALSKQENYYGAQHLMGEYHYLVNEPVDAYRAFQSAIKAYQNPPSFTNSDFYQETESIGRTHAMLGNIFYYFFDKVRAKNRQADDIDEVALDDEMEKRANNSIAEEYYEKALQLGDKSPELYYNLGRLYYLRGLYEKALEKWLNLYDDFIAKPELMFALGNAFFRMNNFESSKGEYLRLISIYEEEAAGILRAREEKKRHIQVLQTLSSAYNNLGAVYQIQGNAVKSNLCYWRSIEYATRINRENEFARVNLTRAFKTDRPDITPLLDEELPFGLDVFRR
jgi:tetratricopeptide (TPR) repeat protein